MPPMQGGKTLTAAEKELLKALDRRGGGVSASLGVRQAEPGRPCPPSRQGLGARTRSTPSSSPGSKQPGSSRRRGPTATTLIRRLSLDLRGLPPSLAEVDEFLAGSIRRSVRELLVDRLLASPHFGEKMALPGSTWPASATPAATTWTAPARCGCAATGSSTPSTANMPFDQFTIEQLAGDLLPNATASQKIASGFNRNTRFNEEGGVDPEEYVIRYNVDRTNTLGQVWLGIDARLRGMPFSHKYDPISHQEYYQLFAFFTGIKEPMVEGTSVHGRPLAPILKQATAEQTKALAAIAGETAVIEKAIAKELGPIRLCRPARRQSTGASQSAWEKSAKADAKLPAQISAALKIEPVKRDADQKKAARDYYLRKINGRPANRSACSRPSSPSWRTRRRADRSGDSVHARLRGDAAAAAGVRALARRFSEQRRAGGARRARRFCPPCPADAPHNRLGLARWLIQPGSSAHRPRRRQSLLGPDLRPGHRPHARRFRQPGGISLAPGIARLARR